MKDNFGRDIYYLRLSVTDLCNLRCIYCMPEDGVAKLRHEDILSVDELAEIARASAFCGIRKVRITGGEPLVRGGIIEICRRIAHTSGVEEVCLTTNGTLLPRLAGDLKNAGVRRLNISLDSLDHETYREITRTGSLEDALSGVDAAIRAGFDAIKINAVLIGGMNDSEIPRLLELTRARGVNVRFIELMPIGESAGWSKKRFISADTVLLASPELTECGSDGVAKLYRLPGGQGTVGLIRPISAHFCPTCNRIRVTADGKLKPCLHSEGEIDIRGLSGSALEDTIRNAIACKPQRHALERGVSASARNMNAIGG